LYEYVPDYFFFRVFCCTCFILHPHIKCNKFFSWSAICVFLGYDEDKKRYHCFDPITQKLYVFCHIIFLEHIHFFFILSITYSLTRFDLICIDLFLGILIVYHLRFLVPQIPLLMFDQFVLIILQVLTLYSPAHLKLHSPLRSLYLRLRFW
jgi:hypothetical protein